ncbi:hypothetical protein B0H16DRAFT_1614464 [Mycena metata]|uniref:Uncharacterized protein n=1 Tax=Mycena metata TaxID=1033252 RepID=A0AAD7HAP9_9AGAR|nr:hypothetical protein B0H16DRAFT_1614464 [Mycena metata]
MPSLPDESLSILAFPVVTSTKVMIVITGLILIVASLRCTSPTRLTRVLSDAMSSLEKVLTTLVCMQLMGLLTADDVARLHMLQLEVGALRAQTLLHSLSWRTTICEFFKGRSFKLYRCINAVRDLETHFRILEEEYRGRCRSGSVPSSFATGVSVPAHWRAFGP